MTKPDPIFILGIMQRSGTNWLRDLLLCHPDCYGAKIPEDFLVANSHLLQRFGSSLYNSWPEKWRPDERVGPKERLHRMLGDALLEFIGQELPGRNSNGELSPPPQRRLVTKTPCVENLEHCFSFFPNSQLIILVRDGRAVVESIVQGFSWDYESAIRHWDRAAQAILRFRALGGPALQRTVLVKYEDLYSDPCAELRRVFAFLELAPSRYDFDRALNLPVRGSSLVGREPKFAPLDRAADWDPWKHERFNHVAGESLEALGYHKVAAGHSSPLAPAIHWYHDAKWSVPRRLITTAFLLKRAFGRSGPDFKDRKSLYYLCERPYRKRPKKAAAQTEAGSQKGLEPADTSTGRGAARSS